MRPRKELNVTIGERVRFYRNSAGISQERLAEMVDVSPQYISDLERGVVGVSVQTIRSLCISLGVSSDAIIFSKNAPRIDLNQKCIGMSDWQLSVVSRMIDLLKGFGATPPEIACPDASSVQQASPQVAAQMNMSK